MAYSATDPAAHPPAYRKSNSVPDRQTQPAAYPEAQRDPAATFPDYAAAHNRAAERRPNGSADATT